MDYEELDRLRIALAQAPKFWRLDLLTPQQLVGFARDRSFAVFNADTIESLWFSGLLRADLIRSATELDLPFLILVDREYDCYTYCDKRPVPRRSAGYRGVFSEESVPEGLELFFHPFRLYVLFHINLSFNFQMSPFIYLLHKDGYKTSSDNIIDNLDSWTSSEQFIERIEYRNRTSELAIVLEPAAYEEVFPTDCLRISDDGDRQEAKLDCWRERTTSLLSKISSEEIDSFRKELCYFAEFIDRNKLVHVLLRLTSVHERLKLRSSLGTAMLLKSMAEIMRRAAEQERGEQFPEEDELGLAHWINDARKSFYGTERILDATKEVQRDFLSSVGLNHAIKVKCYVEGDTEYGALATAVGDGAGVQLVNLHGQLSEKRGKVLSFVRSLKSDQKAHVFSVVLLDGDREDNIRALKKAVRDGAFFGNFFIASPDFEFSNFAIDELVQVVLDVVSNEIVQTPSREKILQCVQNTNSGGEFIKALENIGLSGINKSQNWGAALMKHAIRHKKLPEGHAQAGKIRPMIEAAQRIIVGREASYTRSVQRYRVNPETGVLEERDALEKSG